jgi:assimilatory nitrate reductase catalytic subunit
MARPPVTEAELVARFGPHLNEAPPGGWDADLEVDRVVETHCCFCGQQCGIKLKVHENAVVGFEPWYEFPFNEGKLCPKGVKRYLQGSHPDRLLHPLERDPSAPGGFRDISWDRALERVVSEIQRIQSSHGDDAFAMLSGVSLTNEKSYLIGKFARLALHTANLDYNGRFCMVSAGAGNKKALGVDRSPNPWSDIPLADVVWVAGSNVAETFPITTSYIWRARDRGARLVVQDPRVVPLARTADLFLPVRPGSDSALFGAVLHELVRHDWLDHDFIDAHTVDFDAAVAAVADMTPAWAAEVTGVPAARIEQAAEWWGTAATGMLLHARGIEQQSKGVENVLSAINLGLATGKFGKPGCAVSTITGQGNGQGGREHGHKCDQLPGNRDITNPQHRAEVARVWGVDPDEIPGKGLSAEEIIEAIHAGTIKGLLSICFNPVVSAPDTRLTQEALDQLEFYAVIDFFLSESAHFADVVLPGSLHEEDEGTSTTGEGRIIKINAAVSPPGEARRDWEILLDIADRLGRGEHFRYESTREIFAELCRASSGGTADYTGATWERIVDEYGLFWPVPEVGHPGTPRLFEGGRFFHPDGKARFHAVPFRESAEVVDDEYPIWLTTGRVVSQYLSGTQTRRIAGLVAQYPDPLCEIHPVLAERLGVVDGDVVRVTSRRGAIELPARVVSTIRPDTVFIPYHWPGAKAANQLTNRALDPTSRMPEFKVAAVRVEATGGRAAPTDERDLELSDGPERPRAAEQER